MALETVTLYVDAARGLLQDRTAPYRYPDSDYIDALNFGLLEASRLRADLFIGNATTASFADNDTTPVPFDQRYRVALLYYIAGHVQLQDEEDTEDSRAALFVGKFVTQLTAPAA